MSNCSGDGGYYEELPGRGCFFISTEKRRWYHAREDCMTRGGDLLTLRNQDELDDIKDLIEIYSTSTDRYYWLGLTRRKVTWPNG